MDIYLTRIINGWSGHSRLLDLAMIAVTQAGIYVMIGVVALSWWARERMPARHACIVAGIAFLASLAFNQVLLLFIHRLRPYEVGVSHLLIAPNPDWSFPSDHSTAVAAIVAALWLKGRRRTAAVLGAAAVVICVSRVFVGVHYVSDILGGVLIGAATAWLVARLYRNDARVAQILTRIA